MNTLREHIAITTNESQALRDLGLPKDAVFSADTLDSITVRPFVVFRWLDQTEAVGRNTYRPFTAWVYDEQGNFDRLEKIGKRLVHVLKGIVEPGSVALSGGYLLDIRGGIQGRDSYDTGYDAVTVPWQYTAVANCD